ncbi:MAG: hypothetical protein ABEH58_08460 [Haloplanus sp.]
MVKNTVRFHESVVDEIESLVDEGVLESKSEFYRFASEYVLTRITDDYEPHMVDFDSVKAEVIPDDGPRRIEAGPEPPEEGIPFFESAAIVRKYALRGDFDDAEDFIDHHYDPNERDGLLLEELLELYRESCRTE